MVQRVVSTPRAHSNYTYIQFCAPLVLRSRANAPFVTSITLIRLHRYTNATLRNVDAFIYPDYKRMTKRQAAIDVYGDVGCGRVGHASETTHSLCGPINISRFHFM